MDVKPISVTIVNKAEQRHFNYERYVGSLFLRIKVIRNDKYVSFLIPYLIMNKERLIVVIPFTLFNKK